MLLLAAEMLGIGLRKMKLRNIISGFSLCCLVLPGFAAPDGPSPATSTNPAAQNFDKLYSSWHREYVAVSYSSNSHDYIMLPSFRKIVEMGRPALPYLERKMRENDGMDFFLAYAAAEILGWKRRDFHAVSEQEFRDQVLRRLQEPR